MALCECVCVCVCVCGSLDRFSRLSGVCVVQSTLCFLPVPEPVYGCERDLWTVDHVHTPWPEQSHNPVSLALNLIISPPVASFRPSFGWWSVVGVGQSVCSPVEIKPGLIELLACQLLCKLTGEWFVMLPLYGPGLAHSLSLSLSLPLSRFFFPPKHHVETTFACEVVAWRL